MNSSSLVESRFYETRGESASCMTDKLPTPINTLHLLAKTALRSLRHVHLGNI